jgi:hypothetical protein
MMEVGSGEVWRKEKGHKDGEEDVTGNGAEAKEFKTIDHVRRVNVCEEVQREE